MNPIEAAKQKANQKPRPLTDEEQAKVDAARVIPPAKLDRLVRKYGRTQAAGTVENIAASQSKHGKNGWSA
jgi:hypothetical protein